MSRLAKAGAVATQDVLGDRADGRPVLDLGLDDEGALLGGLNASGMAGLARPHFCWHSRVCSLQINRDTAGRKATARPSGRFPA